MIGKTKAETETKLVADAIARPFILGPARSWKERLAQLDFALEAELSKVAS